jgi:hypothetical protein
MSVRLDSKPQIHTLASDLGPRHTSKPCQDILRSVEARVRSISNKFKCKTLNELLLSEPASVAMPEAAVHEHNATPRWKNDIRSSR